MERFDRSGGGAGDRGVSGFLSRRRAMRRVGMDSQ